MNPVNVKYSTYSDFNKQNNDKDPKYKIGENVRISKYKNIFAKVSAPDWSEEVFVIKKNKNDVTWIYVVSDLNGEEISERFLKKNFKKTNQSLKLKK